MAWNGSRRTTAHLGHNNEESEWNNDKEDKEYVVLQQLDQEQEGQRQYQVGGPVDSHACGQGGASRLLSKHLTGIHKGNGTEADGKAANEQNDEEDAQVGYPGVGLLQDEAQGHANECGEHEGHGKCEQGLAAEFLDERDDGDGAEDVDEACGDDGVLDLVLGHFGVPEDLVRVEEDGVDAAELLGELEGETCDQGPSVVLDGEELLEADGWVRAALLAFLQDLLDLVLDICRVSEPLQDDSGGVLVLKIKWYY